MTLEAKLELILTWADESGIDFDTTFVVDLQNKFHKYGNLTERQEKALDNIIERWRIEEWAEEQGYL